MLTTAALLACVIVLLCLKLSTVNSSQEPPILKRWLPFIGNAHLLYGDTKHLWNVMEEISRECLSHRHARTLFLGFWKYYVLTDPDDCLIVANSCLQKDAVYDFGKPFYGQGLVTASVPIWKEHRKILNPVFNQKYMLDYLGVFNEQARNLVKNFSVEIGKGPFDHEPYVRYIAMEAICITALGMDFQKSKWNASYSKSADTLFEIFCGRFQNLWLHSDFIWNLTYRKKAQDKHIKELQNISNEIIEKRKKTFDSNKNLNLDFTGKTFKPFLDLLFELNAIYEKEIFTNQLIREHVNTFIVAGHDTVAATLVYTLLLVGSYPDVQNKIYAELRKVFEESDRDVAKEDLLQLVYLEAVIKESMRIYPTVPVIARKVDKDIKLKNYKLLSGNSCILFIYGVQKHPMWGEDSEQFKPERWLDSSTLPRNSNAFAAFSLGRRMCIGRTYAMFFMKTVLAHVLRQYHITGDHEKMIKKWDVMLKPVMGHYISLKRRISRP